MIDPVLLPGLMREAVVAVDRGATPLQAAQQFGLNAYDVLAAVRPDSPVRRAMREASVFLRQPDESGRSVVSGY